MSIKFTATVDSRDFDRALKELTAFTDKTLDEALRQQAKLAVKDAVKLTPPFHKFGSATSRKHLKAGEGAIERDLNNVFTGASASFIESGIVANNGSRHFITRKHRTKDGKVFLTDWAIASTSMADMEPFHKSRLRRGSASGKRRGRIKGGGKGDKNIGRWKEEFRMVVPYGNLAKYKKEVKSKVGYLKDGWSKAIYRLGLKAQRWIGRHDAPGGYSEKFGKQEKFVSFSNGVPYMNETGMAGRILKYVYKSRIEKMEKQMARIIRSKVIKRNY